MLQRSWHTPPSHVDECIKQTTKLTQLLLKKGTWKGEGVVSCVNVQVYEHLWLPTLQPSEACFSHFLHRVDRLRNQKVWMQPRSIRASLISDICQSHYLYWLCVCINRYNLFPASYLTLETIFTFTPNRGRRPYCKKKRKEKHAYHAPVGETQDLTGYLSSTCGHKLRVETDWMRSLRPLWVFSLGWAGRGCSSLTRLHNGMQWV